MKKLLSVFLAVLMTASMTDIAVSAHGGHHDRGHHGRVHHKSTAAKIVYQCEEDCTYCDEDEDGICDNCGTNGVCSVKPRVKSKRHCHN